MSKLYFRYGAMNASKSMQLLTVAHNYEEQGKEVLVFVPAIDDRYGVGKVTSRVGISREALIVNEETDLLEITKEQMPHCVLVDESQFLKPHHIHQLINICDELNIPVICYGLLKDYRNKFWAASELLVLHAESIEEIKTVCCHPDCNRKATFILKKKEGNVVYEGEQLEIGGNDTYFSVCRKHYYTPEGI